MQYITGVYALNLRCSLETTGDWHSSALNWERPETADTEESVFGTYGIEDCSFVPQHPGVHKRANHIRALLDLIADGRFSSAGGMKNDFICADQYTPEVFEKVLLLKDSGRWPQISVFMGREYGAEWLDFLEGRGEATPYEVIRCTPLPATHAAFLRDCATFVTQACGQLTVTGEAALALCYGLERPAENLELICSGGDAAGVLRRFCAARSVSLSLINEVLIRREFLIRRATDELRVIVSYRKARDVPAPVIGGIRVSEPDTLASLACFAFSRSRHLRDLYDLAFVVRLFFDRISEERKFDICNALGYFESSDFEYLLRTQEDCLIDKTKLVNDYRAMCRMLGISSEEFLP